MTAEGARMADGADGVDEVEEFSLKRYIQVLTRICKEDFETVTSVADMVRLVCSKKESLTVGPLLHREGVWPRKDVALARRNREEGNTHFQEGR